MNNQIEIKRKRIGQIALQDSYDTLLPLDERKEELRDKLIMEFLHKRTKEVVDQKVSHINGSREVAEHIRFFFDEDGNPPKHTKLRDIISFRQRVEKEIAWLEALSNELKRELRTLKTLERSAEDVAGTDQEDDI
jgi:hypothetical protein